MDNLYFDSLLSFFLASRSAIAEKPTKNSLPSSPNTGSPEEDFAAGGSRNNPLHAQLCGENSQIAYVLGDHNREYTLSAYPIFWFHIPQSLENVAQINFSLTDLASGKEVYRRGVEVPEKAGIMGISLPKHPQYALSAGVNYSWHLEIDCAQSDGESVFALEGWLQRLPVDQNVQAKLATVAQNNQYTFYLQHNLLYDALSNLAQRRMVEPKNADLAIAWQQFLSELGWQDLVKQYPVEPYFMQTKIVTNYSK